MLKKNADKWEFESEEDLENFVWENLQILFNLKPLKRQYPINAEKSDILAISEERQLAIIELKNIEDRYVVQQLTRYYENLYNEKPFATDIDYQKRIRLIAIAPSFHRHNFIDRKHHQLLFEFIIFEIFQSANQLNFILKTTEGNLFSKIQIPYPQEKIILAHQPKPDLITISEPHKSLLRMLENETIDTQDIVLKLREKILIFDKSIGEKSTNLTITYGQKKKDGELCKPAHKLLGGFQFLKGASGLKMFLYLPYRYFQSLRKYMRNQYNDLKSIKISILTDDWKIALGYKIPSQYSYQGKTEYDNIEGYLQMYEIMTGKSIKSKSIDALVDVALSEWQNRNSS
ncbi:endonuclease NucS domain-containing protein [Dapis sp. BLCC M172]|uniref:endonuclease NucS domain-containing protein n=1 Tax=Dapis sp. BLCC M172 TaxID=2975281 RepID=UPI003CF9FBB0